MPKADRPPSFQFYPRDFVASRCVRLMSPEARGGYLMLLCHAWMADEPGVLDDEDSTLSLLSELGDRWPACAGMIRRAFRATSREGRRVLVQERMVQERMAQERYRHGAMLGGTVSMSKLTPEQRSSKARAAANARWRKDECPENAESMPADAHTASASASASKNLSDKIAPGGADAVNRLIATVASGLSPSHPRAPLMTAVRAAVDGLPPPKRNRVFAFAGWLAKSGMDLECVLRFVTDAIPRLDEVRSLQAYYAPSGAARATIEGHYRADQQDRESKRWKDEEWAWARQFQSWKEAVA